MQIVPKEFVFRTIRAVLFIGLSIACCIGVASLGVFVAGKYGLTTSREQVPLSYLAIAGEEVELPQRGKITEGTGWTLRNTRGMYTLTLDDAVVETKGETAAVEVFGDLVLELKKGTKSRLEGQGNAVKKGEGTLTIRGEGSLEIQSDAAAVTGSWEGEEEDRLHPSAVRLEGGNLEIRGMDFGICDQTVEVAGSSGMIAAEAADGIGIAAGYLKIEPSPGTLTVRGEAAAAVAASVKQREDYSVFICNPREELFPEKTITAFAGAEKEMEIKRH